MNQVSLHTDGTVSFYSSAACAWVRDSFVSEADLASMTQRDQKRVRRHMPRQAWFDDGGLDNLDTDDMSADELRAAAYDNAETFGREAF